jgi:hypothetical protein
MPKRTRIRKPAGTIKHYKFEPETAEEILRRIALGESLRSICKDRTLPSRDVVHCWLFDNPEFTDQYARAKEKQAEAYADEMEELARDKNIDTNRARLIIDTRKWIAAKLLPKKYGDKVDFTSGGEAVKFIVQVTDDQS